MARTIHTIQSERGRMRELIGDDDLADLLVGVIVRVAESDTALTELDFLRELKMNVHNVFVIAQRDPAIAARREAALTVEAEVGETVTIVRAKPKRLIGIQGEVVGKVGERLSIRLGEDARLYAGNYARADGTMLVLPTMVKKAEAPVVAATAG